MPHSAGNLGKTSQVQELRRQNAEANTKLMVLEEDS